MALKFLAIKVGQKHMKHLFDYYFLYELITLAMQSTVHQLYTLSLVVLLLTFYILICLRILQDTLLSLFTFSP